MLTEAQLIKGYDYLRSVYKGKDSKLVYNSIDVREADFKAAPVDNNIFPAGFNNISRQSVEIFEKKLHEYFSLNDIKSVILLCEEHTRNAGYLRNAFILLNAIRSCGVDVVIATFASESKSVDFDTFMTTIHKIGIFENKIGTEIIPNPDLIILNNDLSGKDIHDPMMQVLVNASNVMPSAGLGWHRRKKSDHFFAYQSLAEDLATHCGFDSWLINAYHTTAKCHDFKSEQELTALADATADLLKKIKAKYKEYKIPTPPAVFLKSESGTYGLGVEKIGEAKDLLHPNRTFRKNIVYSKSKTPNTDFLLQEAVPTSVQYNEMTAERTMYTTFGNVFGGFYRIHKDKTVMENLNSKGAEFVAIPSTEAMQEISNAHFIATISSFAVENESK